MQEGHISVLRNPDISHVLYLRGLMEKAGRGSVLMIQQCRENGLAAPEWKSDANLGVTVTFRTPQVTPQVKKLLSVLDGEMSTSDLMAAMGLKDRVHFREGILRLALQAKVVEMTEPDKPKSSKQRYRLTPLGQQLRMQSSS